VTDILCFYYITEHTPCNQSLGVGICPLSYECYELLKTCDGIVDCTDGYDEIACRYLVLYPKLRLSVYLTTHRLLCKFKSAMKYRHCWLLHHSLLFRLEVDLHVDHL